MDDFGDDLVLSICVRHVGGRWRYVLARRACFQSDNFHDYAFYLDCFTV